MASIGYMDWSASDRVGSLAGGGPGSGGTTCPESYLPIPKHRSRIAIRSPSPQRHAIDMAAPSATSTEARYSTEIPVGLPTAELQKVTIEDLFAEADENTSQRLFKILSTDGFFYLDLNSKGCGQDFLRTANELRNTAEHVFKSVSVAEMELFAGNVFGKDLDRGYKALEVDDESKPAVVEVLNVSTASSLSRSPFIRFEIIIACFSQILIETLLTCATRFPSKIFSMTRPTHCPPGRLNTRLSTQRSPGIPTK